MQRRTAQSMLGMLMASAITASAFAQEAPPALPPAGAPVIAPQPAPAAEAAPAVAATAAPAVATPAVPAVAAQPAAPAAAAPATTPATGTATTTVTPSLPTVPVAPAETAKPSFGTVLSDMARSSVPTVAGTEVKTYSYGTSDLSILFLPTQTDRMQQAIRTYENSAGTSKTTFVAAAPVVEAAKTQAINEPASYPVFYLASIAYNSPNDWSLWISGHKITSRKNDTDLTVVHVAPDSVTFSWAPTYISAINQRHAQKQFAPTDAVKNRMLKSAPINLSETGLTFTLHPNQSFTVGYFSMFEGFIASPAVPPFVVATNGAGETETLTGAPAAIPAAAIAAMPPSRAGASGAAPGMMQRPGMPGAMPQGAPPNH